jgi:FkbM family methyltransferase
VNLPFDFLGTKYGGWPLLASTPRGAVVYSFGIGEDISFDLGAIERFGCLVHGFDPTPRSLAWVRRQTLPEQFAFHPIGIAAEDGEAEFFAPAIDGHVSFSASPSSPAVGKPIKAPVMRLETILSRFNHRAPAILKMDIEGFEYGVIDDILAGSLRPSQLLVEFHHGMYDGIGKEKTIAAVDALRNAGYRIFYVSDAGREYGFCR